MSESIQGIVMELFVSVKNVGKKSCDEISVDENGVIGDKYYAKGPERSILVTSNDSYLLAKKNDINAKYGVLGENILIDLNPYGLSDGDKLIIGEVELAITQSCTICNSLAKVDEKLPSVLKSDRGIFAKTLKSGKIRKGDIVNVLKY